MARRFEESPGHMYFRGKRFACPCGEMDFKVEIGTDPVKFWCECGAWYTEFIVDNMLLEVPSGN